MALDRQCASRTASPLASMFCANARLLGISCLIWVRARPYSIACSRRASTVLRSRCSYCVAACLAAAVRVAKSIFWFSEEKGRAASHCPAFVLGALTAAAVVGVADRFPAQRHRTLAAAHVVAPHHDVQRLDDGRLLAARHLRHLTLTRSILADHASRFEVVGGQRAFHRILIVNRVQQLLVVCVGPQLHVDVLHVVVEGAPDHRLALCQQLFHGLRQAQVRRVLSAQREVGRFCLRHVWLLANGLPTLSPEQPPWPIRCRLDAVQPYQVRHRSPRCADCPAPCPGALAAHSRRPPCPCLLYTSPSP